MNVVATGARSRSASARSSSQAPAASTPPPAQIAGRSRPGEEARRLVERGRVRRCDRPGRPVEGSHRHARLPFQHVPRHLDVDGPGGRGQRPAPGLREQLRDRLRALGPRGRLDDRRERRELVGQLVQVAAPLADQLARDLGGDRDHRHVGAGCLHQRGERDQRPRPRREEERRGPAADARVAVGGEAGVQLGAQRDTADAARAQRLPHRQGVDPGQPERELGPERLERLDDDVPTRPAGHCGSLPWLKRRHQRPRKSRVHLGGRAHVGESHPVSRRVRVALVAGAETDRGDAGLARPVDAVRRELPDAGLRRAPERRRGRGEGGTCERRACSPRATAGRRAGARRARAARRRRRGGERSRGAAPARRTRPRRASGGDRRRRRSATERRSATLPPRWIRVTASEPRPSTGWSACSRRYSSATASAALRIAERSGSAWAPCSWAPANASAYSARPRWPRWTQRSVGSPTTT